VVIASSSLCLPDYPAYYLADLTQLTVFNSKNNPNQWFSYDFRDRGLTLTHYVIVSYHIGQYRPLFHCLLADSGSKWGR
jgi:hypothetical protein